jgi:type I restriction enzyme S subunit
VDFDPVRAKAEGRDTGLPTNIAALFPESFDESSLGEIPNGWTVEPIEILTDVMGGSTPSTKEPHYWAPETHAWATPKDLSNLQSPVLLKTERRVSDKGLGQISSGLLPIGTVLMSSRAPIGYLAVAEIPVAINQGFIAMKPKEGISNLFLLYWAEVAQNVIKSRANGSTFLEISKSNFRQIETVRPSGPVMKKFDAIVSPWYKQIVNNEKQSATLVCIRDALLPKLISGEIRLDQKEERA